MTETPPVHVFICRSYYHVLQAILFVIEHKEKTDIFLCRDHYISEDECKFNDTDLITFRVIDENIACVPVAFIVVNKNRTRNDILACRYLYDQDIQVHAFSPVMRYGFYNRDDIILHEDGDASYWRTNEGVFDTAKHVVHRVMLRQLPDGYDRKSDRKIKVWNFLETLRNLAKEDLDMLLHSFNVKKVNPIGKSLLFVHRTTTNAPLLDDEKQVICEKIKTLLDDLRDEGWDVWFKGHPRPKSNDFDTGCTEDRIIPGYIPTELMELVIESPFQAAVSIRSTAVDTMTDMMAAERYNAITGLAARELELNKDRDPYAIYSKGLKKIAIRFLKKRENLAHWATFELHRAIVPPSEEPQKEEKTELSRTEQ